MAELKKKLTHPYAVQKLPSHVTMISNGIEMVRSSPNTCFFEQSPQDLDPIPLTAGCSTFKSPRFSKQQTKKN